MPLNATSVSSSLLTPPLADCRQKAERGVRSGSVPQHGAENRGIKTGGGDEKGYRVVVTGELMALREKGWSL